MQGANIPVDNPNVEDVALLETKGDFKAISFAQDVPKDYSTPCTPPQKLPFTQLLLIGSL